MTEETDNAVVASMTVEELRDACVNSYATFCLYMQDDGYFDEVHEQLCQWTQFHVEQAEAEVEMTGTCLLELAYIMPRGSLKSTIVTKYLPAWLAVRRFYKFNDSSFRACIVGNTFNNASAKMHGDLGGLFTSHTTFKQLFEDMLPKKGRDGNKWSTAGLEINRTGSFPECTFECAGTNTKLIGRHYNMVVEDDTTAPDVSSMKDGMTMPSQEIIQQAIGFHQSGTSLFIPKDFRISVVVSTRWAAEDLISHVLEKENYKYFNKPALDADGKPNFSIFYNMDSLMKISKKIGSYMFSMLYLNKPLDNSQRIFNPECFHYVEKKDAPNRGYITIAVDPAISEKDTACESSITVNQHVSHGYEKHQYWHEDKNSHKLPFELAVEILDTAEKYHTEEVPVKAIIIETVAYQKALKYILINEMERRGVRFDIVDFQTRQNKIVRITGMQPLFEQGRVHFVKGSLSVQTESQLKQFPHGKLVDTIDSWSMHRKAFQKDDMKHQGYVQDKTDAGKTTWDQAILEIDRKRNRGNNPCTLGSPTPAMGCGLHGSKRSLL